MIIMCRPCTFPMPPLDEQTNNIPEPCSVCGKKMWVSDKKREMKKTEPAIILACMNCCSLRERLFKDLGFKTDPLTDINKIVGSIPEVVEACKKIEKDMRND